MTTRGTPGTWPAITVTERIGGLRLRLLMQYDEDALVGAGIGTLHATWWGMLGARLRRLPADPRENWTSGAGFGVAGPERKYLEAVAAFAAEFGLDRFREVGSGIDRIPGGVALCHMYLRRLDQHLSAIAAARRLVGIEAPAAPTWTVLASFVTAVPEVDLTVAGRGIWDPRTECRADARRRLRATGLDPALIEADLSRIVREGGYVEPDTSPELDRDAIWTFQRIRHRWTFAEIAQDWDRHHPGELQYVARADDTVRRWRRQHPDGEAVVNAADVTHRVRDAVNRYGERAVVAVSTGPGRRPTSRRFG